MKVTEKDVLYVADLANLELTSAERDCMVRDLNNILDYVGKLNELDTSSVPDMAQISGAMGAGVADRDDILEGLRKSLSRVEALAGAPDTDGTFFKVPKVIEK
jgi:aspartyl-tRNA(Asn)/glutamyl-tRNA(Gln) amidotransferase subunit C